VPIHYIAKSLLNQNNITTLITTNYLRITRGINAWAKTRFPKLLRMGKKAPKGSAVLSGQFLKGIILKDLPVLVCTTKL